MPSQLPLISIIIPVYNVAEFLPQCIESVLNQTYKNLEILVVNDGSTDKSDEICKSYSKKDNRIKVIHKLNGGVSSARNAGLNNARGEWIGFVDSDDWIEPDMFEKLINAAKKNNKQIAVCGHVRYHTDKIIEKRECLKISGNLTISQTAEYLVTDRYFEGFVWNKLFDSSLFIDKELIRFDEDLHFCEDLILVSRCLLKTDGIVYVSKALYHYVLRKDGAMYSYDAKRRTELEAWRRARNILEATSIEVNKNLCVRYTEASANLFRMAMFAGDMENIHFFKREALRYIFNYLFKTSQKFKFKLRCFMILFFPNKSEKIRKILKRQRNI